MGNFLYEIGLSLGRMARRRGLLPGLLLLPAAVLLWGVLFPPETLEQPVEVGLCPPQQSSATAQALCGALLEDTGGYVRFVVSDPDTARERVAAGIWDCAFVLAEDFDAVLDRGGAPIRVVVSQGSVLSGPAREAVACALLQVRAADLTGEYLAGSGLMADGEEAVRQVAEMLHNDRPMTVIRVGGAAQGTALAQTTAAPLVRGLAALLLLCCALMAGAELRRARQSPWYVRAAGVAGQSRLLLFFLSGWAVLPLAVCALALTAGTLLLPGFGNLGEELACLLLYQAALIPLALVFSRVPGAEELTGVCLPYAVIACVLLCPIFFDAGLLVSTVYPLSRALPPTWYLIAAQQGSVLLLWAGCVGLWAAAVLLEITYAIWKRKGIRCFVLDAVRS